MDCRREAARAGSVPGAVFPFTAAFRTLMPPKAAGGISIKAKRPVHIRSPAYAGVVCVRQIAGWAGAGHGIRAA